MQLSHGLLGHVFVHSSQYETHRGAIDLYCFLCKKVAMPQPSTKLLETSVTLTVCCEPDLILLEQICPTMFGCRYHDS